MTVSTEDYVGVSDLLGRYCWAVDDGKADEWVALWEPDGRFQRTGRDPLVGHAALAAVPADAYGIWGGQLRHQVGNLFCDYGENDDVIAAQFYSHVTTWHDGANFCMALCKMRLNRTDTGWRIASSDVEILQAPPPAQPAAETGARIADRIAISDCIARYCRGVDRGDAKLAASAYHDDAIERHGNHFRGRSGIAFTEWACEAQAKLPSVSHVVGSQSVEFDGDTAHVETYIAVHILQPNGDFGIMSGRYIDRMECRNGDWRIAARVFVCDASGLIPQNPGAMPVSHFDNGTADASDVSYRRPLRLDASGEFID